jgi:hypothetical protein
MIISLSVEVCCGADSYRVKCRHRHVVQKLCRAQPNPGIRNKPVTGSPGNDKPAAD